MVAFGAAEVRIVGGDGSIVTVALAWALVSATLVAVTEAWVVEVTVGAVNKPVVEIVPVLAVQMTA